jgi:hypothetical protein
MFASRMKCILILILNRVYSEHNNDKEDRFFEYSCRNVGDGSFLSGRFTCFGGGGGAALGTRFVPTHTRTFITQPFLSTDPQLTGSLLFPAYFCLNGFQAAAGLVGTMNQMGTRIGLLVLIGS